MSVNDVEKLVNEYELFNPRQKIDYIFDQCQTEETILKAKDMVELFADRISELEYQLNKDLCCFNKDELINCLEGLLLSSYSSVKSDLKRYYKWCVSQSIISEDVFEIFNEMTYEDINSEKYYKNNYFKDYSELEEQLNSLVVNNTKNEANDIKIYTSSFALILSWLGLDLTEIINLKKENIN